MNEWISDRTGIEERTRTQFEKSEWNTKRRWLITASKIRNVCRRLTSTRCENHVASVVYPRTLDGPAIDHGLRCEKKAKDAVEDIYGTKVNPCGLFLDPEVPGIAASPDGLIEDDYIVEIKCPILMGPFC